VLAHRVGHEAIGRRAFEVEALGRGVPVFQFVEAAARRGWAKSVSELLQLGAEGKKVGTHCPTMSTSHSSMRMAPAHQRLRRMSQSLVLLSQRDRRSERAHESTERASALELAARMVLKLVSSERLSFDLLRLARENAGGSKRTRDAREAPSSSSRCR
jgi:hypothetical protein